MPRATFVRAIWFAVTVGGVRDITLAAELRDICTLVGNKLVCTSMGN